MRTDLIAIRPRSETTSLAYKQKKLSLSVERLHKVRCVRMS